MLDNFLQNIIDLYGALLAARRGQVEVKVLANHLESRETTAWGGIIAIANHHEPKMVILN